MKAKACGRMIWKETVELLPIGVAAIIGIVVFQALVVVYSSEILGKGRADIATLQSIGIKLTLIFGGAVSATLFNRERERKTLGFLQSLPMAVGDFYVGKVAPLAGWVLLLLAIGMTSARTVLSLLGPGTPASEPDPTRQAGWLMTAALAALIVSVGITCSLTIRDVYASIGVTLFVSLALVVVVSSTVGPQGHGWQTLAWCAVTVPLILIGIHQQMAARFLLSSGASPLISTSGAAFVPDSMHRRLVWQQIVHLKGIAIGAIAVGLVAIPCFIGIHDITLLVIGSIGLTVLVALLSAQTFAVDQKYQGYRFLADRGVRPTTVWWSRIWVVGILLLVAIAPAAIAGRVTMKHWHATTIESNVVQSVAGGCFLLLLLAFAVGQFFSQRLASPMLNLFCTFASMGFLAAWAELASLLEIPAYVSSLPFVVALFAATWLYTPNWLVGKRSLRDGWRTFAIPLVGLLICYFGASAYRVYEIPAVSLPTVASLDLKEPSETPSKSQQTAATWTEFVDQQGGGWEMFEVEWLSSESPPFVRIHSRHINDFVKENETLLSQVIDTSNQFQFPLPCEENPRTIPGGLLSRFLLAQARARETLGKTSEAWAIYRRLFEVLDAMRDRGMSSRWNYANDFEKQVYVRLQTWALQVKPEQLRGAVEFLTRRTKRVENLEQVVFDTHYGNQRRIRDDSEPRLALQETLPTDRFFVFEQQRLERLVDRIADVELRGMQLRGPLGGTRWEKWDYPVGMTNAMLFTSPTDLEGPSDFYTSAEDLFRHRQSGLLHMTVMLELLTSPDKKLRDVKREVCDDRFEDLRVEVVSSMLNRSEQDQTWYPSSWYEFGTFPKTWPVLLVKVPFSGQIRTPIPPVFELTEKERRLGSLKQ